MAKYFFAFFGILFGLAFLSESASIRKTNSTLLQILQKLNAEKKINETFDKHIMIKVASDIEEIQALVSNLSAKIENITNDLIVEFPSVNPRMGYIRNRNRTTKQITEDTSYNFAPAREQDIKKPEPTKKSRIPNPKDRAEFKEQVARIKAEYQETKKVKPTLSANNTRNITDEF